MSWPSRIPSPALRRTLFDLRTLTRLPRLWLVKSLHARFLHDLPIAGIVILVGFNSGVSQNLKSPSNRADYIVVAPTRYIGLAKELASFREQTRGYISMAISFDSILSQFATGSTQDSSLREFIQYSLQSWQKPAPKYFVLAGNVNAIPSHREAEESIPLDAVDYDSLSVDHWFVEGTPVDRYGPALAVLGRLPAWDSAGLAVMITKQIEYESTVPAPWWGRSVGLADFDTLSLGFFESNLQELQPLLVPVWHDTMSVHIESASPQHLDSTAFIELWNNGASIITYVGHANPWTLSATRFFTTSSVDKLKNEGRLPLCFFGGCNLRFDAENPTSISTHLLDHPKTGAIACVASTGSNYESLIVLLFDSLFEYLASNPNCTAGEALTFSKNANPGEIFRRITFLGDPAVQIKRPAAIAAVLPQKPMPSSFALDQNFPNPFNPSTTIRFALPTSSRVSLVVFNTLGQQIATILDGDQEAGTHEIRFDGSHLASGVYFCRMTAGTFVRTQKMLLAK